MTRVLGGRYRLVEPLGRGGMGTVWRALDEMLGRAVAVKELTLPRGVAPGHRAALCERAAREARVSSRLKHGSIIRVHDVITEDDRPWIVMELLTGRALDEAGPLSPRRVAEVGLAVLEALGVAHAQGVLHRDVKPGNIFLCDDGRVILADFGIATLEGDASLTASGGLVGSPGYIAPERLRGERGGPPSDLWSLGAALYTAIEGRPPFARQTPMGMLSAVLTEEPGQPLRAGPLGPVLLALLARDPARRPPAEVAARWLRSVAGGGTPVIPARPPDTEGRSRAAVPTEPGGRRGHDGRGRRTAVIAAAAVALAAMVPAAFLLRHGNATSPTAKRTAPPPDPVRGRFASAPPPCSLITSPEATRLGTAPSPAPRSQGCSWDDMSGGSIDLQLELFAPTGALNAPKLAESYYADKKRQIGIAAHAEDKIHSAQSGVTDIPATGDAAFVYDATDGVDAGLSSTVWLRSSNLVVQVVYADHVGTTSAAQVRRHAIEAARTVGGRLGHM
ncbi:protein kinase-like protein [Actinoallomurus bryophytorum]|uniref:non-specific serine/threonine protein kinase n=1 Tax=Actinoallomurus bryophytorum TaxID=1490222 RepID=A0A543CVV2_9ACTN|nr:protein kinase-like protein [Actinoallomurus bryophytorum]